MHELDDGPEEGRWEQGGDDDGKGEDIERFIVPEERRKTWNICPASKKVAGVLKPAFFAVGRGCHCTYAVSPFLHDLSCEYTRYWVPSEAKYACQHGQP